MKLIKKDGLIFFNAEYSGESRSLSLCKAIKDFDLEEVAEDYINKYEKCEHNTFDENLKLNGSFIQFLLISGLICDVQYDNLHLVELSKDVNERIKKNI